MSTPHHLSPEQFRQHGHDLVDWIADYLATADDLPIIPSLEPGAILDLLPGAAPEEPEPFADLMADLERIVKPGLTGWQNPGWFAYFPGNVSPPAILAEMVTAALGQQGMLWATSPVTTEVEMRMVDWLVDLLGLPSGWKMDGPGGGVIQMSASDSSHTALAVARYRAQDTASLDSLVAYVSSQAHSSIEKGARVAGYRHVRLVDVDDQFAMIPDRLEELMTEDRAEGLTPTFVCSTVGTTGTTAIDPVGAIATVARSFDAWHHVDAAFSGSAMICPEFRHHQAGIDLVDSYVFNPHKWLFVNFDCSVFYVSDRTPLLKALSILPPYLRGAAASNGKVVDYRDWHVALGRRFRALKLWWVIRSYGAEGLRAIIRLHVALACSLADRVANHPKLELIAPVPFSLVCFRHRDGDEATRTVAEAINRSGHSYVTPSVIDDWTFIRVVVGQTRTEAAHVDRLWDVIAASA
jgi:aromatic-L-amino-acid decarboxylase